MGGKLHSAVYPRRLRFQLRSADQALFLLIPHTAGEEFYCVLSSGFSPAAVWAYDRGDAHVALEGQDLDAVSGYRLLYTWQDYSLYRYFSRKPVFISLLRHPVARVIEVYEHLWEDEEHPWHSEVRSQNLSLKEFLRFPPAQEWVNNRQTRQLIGDLRGELGDLSPEVMLELARLRLEEFAFIGLSERLADARQLLRYTFDLPHLRKVKRSVIRRMGSPCKPYDAESLQLVKDTNRLDLRLYQIGARIFERRLEQMQYELRDSPDRKYTPGAPRDYRRISLRMGILLRSWSGTVRLGRLRRWLIPEGSQREKRYLQLRKRIFGW